MTGGHPRVAIVHERFTEWGGSEQVVAQLHAVWPDAPIFTSVVDPHILRDGLATADVRPSGLQPLYPGGGHYAHLLPLLPGAMRRIDVGPAEMVIASHHAFANRIRVPDGVRLVSYVHTPARWLWDPSKRASEAGGPAGRAALALFAASQRRADASAARRVDRLVANSTAVATRIRRWWGCEATVLAPPVDTGYFTPDPDQVREDFFLLAGRLVPYKKPDVAVAAARQAGVRLVVVGDGRMRRAVELAAGPETSVLGAVSQEELRRLYRTCAALVFPGDEDFGIVPVEAQACGAPVIARRCGGVLDSVLPGRTGILYPDRPDEVQALADALGTFDPAAFDHLAIRAHAESFSIGAFRSGIRHLVDGVG